MTNSEAKVPATSASLREAFDLSAEILEDIERERVPLSSAALKASRLARLLNDLTNHRIFQYEVSGYPTAPGGFPPEVWELLKDADRLLVLGDPNAQKQFGYADSIDSLINELEIKKIALTAAKDGNVSISSANPNQFMVTPMGNAFERSQLQISMADYSRKLSSRRAFVYGYALGRHYELKFSGVAEDVFSRRREEVDTRLGKLVPKALEKFAAVHDNLRSSNPEDWSNAVHSCRRILHDLADVVFPATDSTRKLPDGRDVKLGAENYINRLVCFAVDHSNSARFQDLVGSHLSFFGDRLDAVSRAAQKGSHNTVTKEEADRYVIYAYMLVGDILSLVI